MRQVAIDKVRPGDRLGRDVYGPIDGPPLLKAGVCLSDGLRISLQRASVSAVWVDDDLSEGIEPLEVLGHETKQRATRAIHSVMKEVSRTLPSRGKLSADMIQEVADVTDLIVEDVMRNAQSALAINDLAAADGYTVKHTVAVTTLGLSLGLRVMRKHGWIDGDGKRRFDCIGLRLTALGVGLLLHDVGSLAVPADILRKSGALADDDWATLRAHPAIGADILKRDAISPLSRAVVRSHHERWNGSGYPDRRSRTNIHQFARIAAVADVFDALVSERHHRRAMSKPEAYAYVSAHAGTEFDPDVVEVFKSLVAPYPPGTGVVLSDGACAFVKHVRPDAVMMPVVRVVMDGNRRLVAPREVDLSKERGTTIVATDFALPEIAAV